MLGGGGHKQGGGDEVGRRSGGDEVAGEQSGKEWRFTRYDLHEQLIW